MKEAMARTLGVVEKERGKYNLTNNKIRASFMLALGLHINDR